MHDGQGNGSNALASDIAFRAMDFDSDSAVREFFRTVSL